MSVRLRALVALPALLMTVLTTLFGTGLATAPAADAATAKHHKNHQASRVDRIIHGRNIALHQIGRPYRYGAAGPKAFDCSGLIYWSYRHAGFSVPRTSSAQAGHARHIPKNRLRTGDFMFFNDGGGVYHVGIFLRWHKGHAIMLHSPKPGQRVQRAVPWTSRWFAGTLR